MRLIIPLSVALLVGLGVGLAWDSPGSPLRRIEARVTEVARRDARAGRIEGPILGSECRPVRATPDRWSCVAVRWQTELGYGGQTYEVARDRRTGAYRISRFDIPIWWGI